MCGYHELQTPCCHEKIGFQPSPSHRCTYYFTNNRYCRTGSIHSWILPIPPLTTNKTCENCKIAKDRREAFLNAEIKKDRERERKELEERRKNEEARQSRLWDKELKRVREERKEEKRSAVEALRSQLAGVKIDKGEGPSSGKKQ